MAHNQILGVGIDVGLGPDGFARFGGFDIPRALGVLITLQLADTANSRRIVQHH